MRVLVTGGTGFIGSHSATALRAAGHEVRLLVRSPEKAERVFGPHTRPSDLVAGDVTDPAAVAKALEGCEGVLHTAAVVSIEASRAREVLDTNRRAVELVVGGAHERGLAHIVYLSSAGALFTPGGPPIHADSPLATSESAYGLSKTEGERFVRGLQEAGAPVRTVYPPAVIGPDDPGLSEGNHTIRTFLKDLMVDTSSGFEAVDVRDLARLNAALLSPDAAPGRYVAGGHYFAWTDLIALLDELTGRRVRRVPVPGPLLRALGRVGDAVKRVAPFDFPLTGEAMDFATQWPGTLRTPAVDALGVRFRDPRATFADTIRWLHASGNLTAAQAGRLAGPAPGAGPP